MTKIEWTDDTWNPTRGCSMAPGSELGGCLNCYAARNQLRRPYQTTSSGKPFAILRDSGPRWSGEVELIESKLTEPLHWRKPRRVFVNSMSDLFHEALPDEAIDRVFAVMALCPHITFQVLTKRADNMRKWATQHVTPDCIDALIAGMQIQSRPEFQWPLPNVWLGVSVENQPTADARIRELLQTPAALRFISYEPALAEVDFTEWLNFEQCGGGHRTRSTRLGWGIVGGESGPQARPCDLAWIESTVDQFQAAGVPLFVKQVGSKPVQYAPDRAFPTQYITDSKGGNWNEWPGKLRVREFPR